MGTSCPRPGCPVWAQDGPAGGLAAHERQVHAGEGPAGLLPGAIVARRDGVATRPAAALERDRVRRRKEAAARARANRPAEG